MSDDLLTALTSGQPQDADKIQAIVAQLRNRAQLGQLAAMSGDPSLAPFGQKILQENQIDQKQLGEQALTNRSEDLRNSQFERQTRQGDAALAENVRYHNMMDQERKDRLAQQAKEKGDLDSAQATIDKIGHYDLPLPLNRTTRNAAIIDAVSTQYPDYDATQYTTKNKARQMFGSGKLGDLSRSADVAIQHLDTADTLAQGLKNGKYPALNAVSNFFATQTGSPSVTKFNAAKNIVSDEINKFVIGGGGALADRELLQKQLDAASSPEQLTGVTNTLRTLMSGQLKGLKGQYDSAIGDGRFLNRFQPRTLKALGMLDDDQSQGAGGPQGGTPGPGSGPPQGPAPGGSAGLPGGSALPGVAAATGGAISPLEGNLRQQTGALADGSRAPPTAVVDNQGIVKTGRLNGKRIGLTASGKVVPLE